MNNDKIAILKKLQESELSAITGQHKRALGRLQENQKNELESLHKKHKNALNIGEDRIINVERTKVEK